jgi:hypothetical protein
MRRSVVATQRPTGSWCKYVPKLQTASLRVKGSSDRVNRTPWQAEISEMRVVSWNMAFRGAEAAKRQGDLLRKLAPDLMLLQELNPGSSATLREAAGADWMVRAIDLRNPEPDGLPLRRHGVAIAGRGSPPGRSWLLGGIRLSERILLTEIQTEGTRFIAVSYHAPPGVNYGIVKPQQAVAFASWLITQNGPLLFGADANTPLKDALNFANTEAHWYTGHRRLLGEPGDDLLFGPAKLHDLDDALRRWLALHPDEMERLQTSQPSGPLAITHRTGKRKNSQGTGTALRFYLGQPPLGRAAHPAPL